MIWFTARLEVEAAASAGDLKEANGALRVNGREAGVDERQSSLRQFGLFGGSRNRDNRTAYGKLPTFAVASVSEFRVVDLPELGLPTMPIRGSRGILATRVGDLVVRMIDRKDVVHHS